MNLAPEHKGPMGLKGDPVDDNPAHLSALGACQCIICFYYGEEQESTTQVHHWIMDRHGSRRTPDIDAIPLCEGHHQGLRDRSKLALHQEPDKWRAKYGADWGFSSVARLWVAQNAEYDFEVPTGEALMI